MRRNMDGITLRALLAHKAAGLVAGIAMGFAFLSLEPWWWRSKWERRRG